MSKRKWVLGMIVAIAVSLGAMPLQATTYYVVTDGNDNDDGLSWSTAFATIGQGIIAAGASDIIEVNEGTYYEKITMGGETIQSIDPNDWDVVANTIIDANSNGTTVTASGTLTGFTIMHGAGSGNGVYLGGGSLTLSNCEVRDNTDGITHFGGSLTVENCKIYDNSSEGIAVDEVDGLTVKSSLIYDNGAAGIGFEYDEPVSGITVLNCTIVGNTNYGISDPENVYTETITNCIVWDNSDDLYNCSATYSCIQDGDSGTGNISSDPCFVDNPNDDYRLTAGSGCIDAADGNVDPTTDILGNSRYDDSSTANTGTGDPNYVDMGAYEVTGVVHNQDQDIWYTSIKDAIDDANNGDEIVIYPGTYEPILPAFFYGKEIIVRSTDPNDWNVVAATVIDGSTAGTLFVFTDQEDANTVLSGLTLKNCDVRAVWTGNASNPMITRCIIEDNAVGMYYGNASPIIIKNLIRDDNHCGTDD